MAYIYFNPNPVGKKVGDCVIRAVAKLTKQSWEKVYYEIAMTGFELCDMPSSNNVWAAYLKRKGYRRFVIPDTCPNCYTVRDFCLDNPRGKFLLATGSHVVTVVDGGSNHNGYSGHSRNDMTIYHIENLIDAAQTEQERQFLSEWLRRVKNN